MIDHDPQTVLDAAKLPAPLLETIIGTYRDLAAANREIGNHAAADRCDLRAAALEYGGSVTLGGLV